MEGRRRPSIGQVEARAYLWAGRSADGRMVGLHAFNLLAGEDCIRNFGAAPAACCVYVCV